MIRSLPTAAQAHAADALAALAKIMKDEEAGPAARAAAATAILDRAYGRPRISAEIEITSSIARREELIASIMATWTGDSRTQACGGEGSGSLPARG